MPNRQVVVDRNVYVGDMSTLNTCDEFTPPSIERNKLSYNTGSGEVSISTPKLKSLDSSFKFQALPQGVYAEIAKMDEAVITVKEAIMDGADVQNHEWELTGGIDIKHDAVKAGEFLGVELSQKGLVKVLYKIDGQVMFDINHTDGIQSIGGDDQMAKVARILRG